MQHSLWSTSCTALLATTAAAQCVSAWESAADFGVNGSVRAMTNLDPDGPGPLPPQLVVAGAFSEAGGTALANIGLFEPTAGIWSSLGSGIVGSVFALAVLPNNDLVAAGEFTAAGGVTVANIARWNGSSWLPLGQGLTGGAIRALLVRANGELIAGGAFTQATGAVGDFVASWNGAAWSALGAGLSQVGVLIGVLPGVAGLGTLPNGDLVAGGGFNRSGGTNTGPVARWNGVAWQSTNAPTGGFGFLVSCVATTQLGVVVGGTLSAATLQRYDGAVWTALPAPSTPSSLVELGNGDLIAGGTSVWRWRAGVLTTLGSTGLGAVQALAALPGGGPGSFAAGGTFASLGGSSGRGLARWTGATWGGSAGFAAATTAVTADSSGRVIVAGEFLAHGTTPLQRIARWDGSAWQPLGAGLGFAATSVVALDNGEVLACRPANGVWRWDGATWSQLPIGALEPTPLRMRVHTDGRVLLVGRAISLWDGATLQLADCFGPLAAALEANGSIVAGGEAGTGWNGLSGSPRVVRWQSGTWTSLDPTSQFNFSVDAVAILPNGEPVVGGGFTTPALRVARLSGGVWQQLGGGLPSRVLELEVLANGDVLALTTTDLFRFDGANWQLVAGAPSSPSANPSGVADLAIHPAGDVLLAGQFTVSTQNYARRRNSCTATAVAVTGACATTGGSNRLVASQWPLLGSRFRSRGSELSPAAAWALMVTGLAPTSLPLSSVLPQGQPGCTLVASPDLLTLLPVQLGAVDFEWLVPTSPSLVGLGFRQQVLPLEFTGAGALAAVTSTNGVDVTIGVMP
ncbi:MAG: hypothetical protein MUC36_20485 [Planctomycetes bacterium]|jgi:hypothetical protein|nr:hypothetical protein [Planctomycetota bacterium]